MAKYQHSFNRYRIRFLSADTKFAIRKYLGTWVIRAGAYLAYAAKPFIPETFVRLDRPIFMIGCSRSGTTLFVDMFARHPDLAHWSEAGQIFELGYFDPDIDHVRTERDATPFHAWRLKAFLGLYTRLRGKARFVNKNLENSMRIRFLKAIFPDALFLHVIRDGRAVVRSSYAQIMKDRYRSRYALGFFPKPPAWKTYLPLPLLLRLAHQWVDIIRHIRATASEVLSDQNYLEVRYEEFCRHPHEVLRRVDAFCGLDADARRSDEIPGHFAWQNFKWHQDFTEQEIADIEAILGDLLEELYDTTAAPS